MKESKKEKIRKLKKGLNVKINKAIFNEIFQENEM